MLMQEMMDTLAKAGAIKKYKPVWDDESETIVITTRRPPIFTDGMMKGTAITFLPKHGYFNVWTNQRGNVRGYAIARNLPYKLYDCGEADINIPASMADQLLPHFGAYIKRTPSPAQMEVLKRARNASFLRSNTVRNQELEA